MNQRGRQKWIYMKSRIAEEISWIFHDSFQDMSESKESKWSLFLTDPSFFFNGRCFGQIVRFFCFVFVVAIIVFNKAPHLYHRLY